MYPFDDFIMILSIRETLCLQTPALWTLQAVLIKILLFNFVLINKRRQFSNTGSPSRRWGNPSDVSMTFQTRGGHTQTTVTLHKNICWDVILDIQRVKKGHFCPYRLDVCQCNFHSLVYYNLQRSECVSMWGGWTFTVYSPEVPNQNHVTVTSRNQR